MKKTLEYWLDLGVDGFYIDSAYHLMEDPDFKNDPLSGLTDDESNPKYTIKTNSEDNFGTFDILEEWREVIHKKNSDAILMVETSDNVENFVKYMDVSDIPLHPFFFKHFDKSMSAQELKLKLENLLSTYKSLKNPKNVERTSIGIPVSYFTLLNLIL
jgi:glycosidase